MALSDRHLLSVPCPVKWCGWSSDTYTLQNNGWSLAAEEDVYDGRLRIAMRHDEMGLMGISETAQYAHLDRSGLYSRNKMYLTDDRPVFHVRYISSKMLLRMHDIEPLSSFVPIDAKPQFHFMDTKTMNVEDFTCFAPNLTRTEEIIVEPDTVMSLLEKIKEIQAPEQERIRKDNRLREYMTSKPREVFHAQILSFQR
jgi:hypothetical protein